MKLQMSFFILLMLSGSFLTAQVSKPDYILSTGFFTLSGKIFNPDGSELLMRGINQNHYWGDETFNLNSINGIARTHANIVRVVMSNADWQNQSRTADKKRALVKKYIDLAMIPMVEQHDGTCDGDAASLEFMTDVWTDPQNVAWLNEFEEYVILNIANEWGPSERNQTGWQYWRDAYKEAVTRIRDAGINNMLVIDSPDCGQGPRAMEVYGRELLDHDPQHNIVFSIHMYGMWRTQELQSEVGQPNKDNPPWLAEWELKTMLDLGLPIIVGEFSWTEASSVGYDTRRLIGFCQENHIGWLAWSWNGNSDPLLDMAKGWRYDSDDDLLPYGMLIVNDPLFGLRSTSTSSSVFGPPPSKPTVELRGPDNLTLEIGDQITLQAIAADADGEITRVQFYQDDELLAEDAAPPYSFEWQARYRGTFQLTAIAWDNDGHISPSQPIEFRVGYRAKTVNAALIVGDTELKPADLAIFERLEMLGCHVAVIDDDQISNIDLQQQNLLFISATCVPTRVKSAFQAVELPIIVSEYQLFDDMNMSGNRLNSDYGRIEGSALSIVDNSHPAAGGLTGEIVVYRTSDRINWAQPSANAHIISSAVDDPTQAAIFIYDKGESMVVGQAPAARIGFFLHDASAEFLTPIGWLLFDAAVDYGLQTGLMVDDDQATTIRHYELLPNYPNPFNPLTTVEFFLPAESEITLSIFNIQGQMIKRLASGRFIGGSHRVIWDGTTDHGSPAANGLYYYQLSRGDDQPSRRLTRKMMLIR